MNPKALGKLLLILAGLLLPATGHAQLAIRGRTVYTMSGPPIKNGVVLIQGTQIQYVGPADKTTIPADYQQLAAQVVTPGLIDGHATLGTSGILNYDHDQEQLEHAQALQPELRAIDAYNPQDPLIDWVRSFGVTTAHTGHAPGELISGQTMVVKMVGQTVEQATLRPVVAVACTLAATARKSGEKSPGTRGKMMAMLREELVKATEYQRRRESKDPAEDGDAEQPERDLHLETLVQVLQRRVALMVTADRAQDIANALRLQREFSLRLWLDSAAEAYLLIDEIKAAGVPVIIHPSMARASGDRENLSFETAAKLVAAGVPVVMQGGYEAYVPKSRVVLFEAAWAAANGLTSQQALATITTAPAKMLGLDERIGSLTPGKDADVALYDGDPFEYTSHCVGVVINGQVVSRKKR